MPSNRKNLSEMLSGETAPPEIRRGRGLRLSTETADEDAAPLEAAADAQSQERTTAKSHKPLRVNRGYTLREDYIKQLKRIALDEDRKLYEVMDEALAQYLARRRGQDETP